MENIMKKLFILLVISLSLATSLMGYDLIWANYSLINPGSDVTRGLAYNSVTDHIYIATRIDNKPRIVILDPDTGTEIGMLDTTATGFEGGVYPLNLVAVADDGVIYVCNLSAPSVVVGDQFKIYRYTDEGAQPELIFDNPMDGVRYGDSFAAIGSGANTFLYSSGYQSDKLAVIKVDSRSASLFKTITLPSINSARHGISPVEPEGEIWINGAGDSFPPPRLIDFDGNIIVEIPDTIIAAGGSSAVLHWMVGSENIITATNTFLSNTLRSGRYSVDELGTITFDYLGGNSDSLMLGYEGTTLNNNQNGSCNLVYDNTRHCLYTLMGVNSIAAVTMDSLVHISTPRNWGVFTVELDGKNKEYTHYDKIGEDNGRELYLTWSDEIVYVGVNGSTLYAPYQERGLYIAFDTDPSGSNGSPTLPDEASGIQSLPFNADVIIQMDSDDYADLSSNSVADKWTTGHVYKWNGSSWSSGEITGLDINYGAMCLIGDGTDSLITEIGVARTPVGIGTNVMAMRVKVYLAELSSSGTVLAAFPNNGETGAGVSFSSYYEFSDVGDGIYPAFDVAMVGAGTSVEPQMTKLKDYRLSQNYPNPFNPVTWIDFELPKAGEVRVIVYDINGREVSELMNGYRQAGLYHISFDGSALASGVYFYQMWINGNSADMRKMLLIK